ncbi:unnamed protein product [Cyprideis torosa]|uniref:Splicing factor 3A subunit 1 conserved domain-containing protein n=1 Tax=Cyprideis torosa TaxID=163714 RepID=A0A7R8WSI4_9CRUS|nr:unnamed protein product [Cyprideis torosa]CAG0908220.1 unnamed protein product [Cyprideis torosa]
MKRLQDESNAQVKVLEDVRYRAEWIRHEERQKQKIEEEAEKERLAYAQIDWHDFVVVETVDYQPWETGQFPGPTTPEEVGARVLMEERGGAAPPGEEDAVEMEEVGSPERDVADMDESGSSDEEGVAPSKPGVVPLPGQPPLPPQAPPPAQPPTPDQVIVKKGYDPKGNKLERDLKR